MDREALQAIVGPDLDLASSWSALCKTVPAGHEPSIPDFIAYLFNQQLISFKQLEAIHQAEPVTMSEAEQLQAHLTNQAVHAQLYQIKARLGQGAMGVVHLAKDRSLLREVALKSLLAPEKGMPPIVIRRFLNEVQITAQLDHPQIIPIYHLSATESGMPAYTMKCIEGKTFKELIAETREQIKQKQIDDLHLQSLLLEHFLKVCDAMAYAHSRSVIHRDLKPANLMVGPHGDVYVMDWGIAKRIHDPELETTDAAESVTEKDPDATQMGQILGTLRYMSPQQAAAKNKSLDGRSDIFALGLILFELLGLQPAYTGKSQLEVLKRVLKADLNPLVSPAKNWPISGSLRAIIAKATTQKTGPRYASVEDFARDIRRSLNGQTIPVYQESWLERVLRRIRRHARATLLSVLAIATTLLVLSGISLAIQVQASRSTARQAQQLASLLTAGGAQAQAIDSAFLEIQNQLEGLAASAETQWQQTPAKPNTRLYWNQDYGLQPPPDTRFSPYYGRKISLHEGGFKAAPGLSQAQAIADARQIYALKNVFYAIFKHNMPAGLSSSALEKKWLEQGNLLDWAYVGLASGLHYAYPGKGGYADDYDPRKRPWYQEALSRRGSFWGLPYADASGQGLILPCLRALYTDKGHLIGVAGLELKLTRVIEQFLNISDQPSLQGLFLADQTGRVLLQSKPSEARPQIGKQAQTLPKALVEEIIQKSNGVYETPQELWVYYRINALNWFYILKIDPQQLFHAPA